MTNFGLDFGGRTQERLYLSEDIDTPGEMLYIIKLSVDRLDERKTKN